MNFSGVWKLIRGESDFGFLPPPRLRIDTIVQHEQQLQISTRQKDANGSITVERNLEIGGGPTQILIHGRPRMIRAYLDGPQLVIETLSEVSGTSRRIEDRWSLDDMGQWLTIARMHEQPGGAVHQRLRLRREGL